MGRRIIGVIGQGFVGGALTQVASRHCDVWAYDKAGKLAPGAAFWEKPGTGKQISARSVAELVLKCESETTFTNLFFVCVPTPMRRSGECDISIVQSVLDEIAAVPFQPNDNRSFRIAVVKSTVPPGSCAMWNERYAGSNLKVIFNPEFLTEANALKDFEQQDRIILGGEPEAVAPAAELYEFLFRTVPVIKTTTQIAETVKYMTNAFLAVKVAFANEMRQLCDAMTVDYEQAITYAKLDKRLGDTHWRVPGPDGAWGFGGHCFPKDLSALMHHGSKLGVATPVMAGAWEKNLEVRAPADRDWRRMIGRAVSE